MSLVSSGPSVILVAIATLLASVALLFISPTTFAAPHHQSVENAEVADAAGSNTNNRAEVPTYAGEGPQGRGPAPRSARALGGGEPLTADAALIYSHVAAWNAGDANAVTLLFSPDAQIRQRSPWIEDIGDKAGLWDVYGTAFVLPFSALRFDHGDIVWATGRAEIRTWIAGLLRDGHRVDVVADSLRPTADGRLAWDYRASTAAQRGIAGVGPTAGHAEATIRAGALTTLTIETDLTSALRRIREVLAASQANTDALQFRASASGAAASLPPGQPAVPTVPTAGPQFTSLIHVGPEDTDSRLLVLLATGVGAFVLLRLRRARPPRTTR